MNLISYRGNTNGPDTAIGGENSAEAIEHIVYTHNKRVAIDVCLTGFRFDQKEQKITGILRGGFAIDSNDIGSVLSNYYVSTKIIFIAHDIITAQYLISEYTSPLGKYYDQYSDIVLLDFNHFGLTARKKIWASKEVSALKDTILFLPETHGNGNIMNFRTSLNLVKDGNIVTNYLPQPDLPKLNKSANTVIYNNCVGMPNGN